MPDASENLKSKLNATPKTPLEETRKFLRRYWSDEDGSDTIYDDMKRTISLSPKPITAGLQAIEALLKAPLPEGTLLHLVVWDANHPLEEATEEAARAWLQEIAEFTREVIESL